MKAFNNISKSNKFLEKSFFTEGDIKTLSQQRKKFDEALVAPKPISNKDIPKKIIEPVENLKPKQNDNSKKETMLSKKMLNDLHEKRDIYLRSVFREEDDIYNVQSRFVEYEHQIRKTTNNMDTIFSSQPPKGRENEHENAIMSLYNELEVWESFQNYNKNKGFSDFKNLENTPISEIRKDISDIINAKIPGKLNELKNPEKLQDRGKSILGEENINKSFLQDQSFIRKKEQIRSLRSKQKTISKPQDQNEPQINIKPPEQQSENDIRENKEELDQIGENSGEQVSQINVEEDSEIEYNLENISGKKVK